MTTDREVLQEALSNRLEGDENGEDTSDENMGYVLRDQVDPEKIGTCVDRPLGVIDIG